MSRRIFLLLFPVLAFIQIAYSQDTIPLLTGKVTLSITKGTIACDFTLSDIPAIENYYIRINSGMNIHAFRDLDYNNLIYYEKSFADTMSTGETNAYYFPAGNEGKRKYLPRKIQFRYVGMYPVIREGSGDFSVEDWKGNLSFNGYSLRVDGMQSAWYPVLYDINNDRRYDKLRYDIEVDCADCNSIYVNGSLPVKGSTARFQSTVPYQLTLFSGKYDFNNIGGSYFLNPDLNSQDLEQFATITNRFKSYLQGKLSIPYKGNPVFIQTTPTSEKNSWLFVSYPTIVNIGRGQWGMKKFIEKSRADWARPYIAHELGHYYFGTYKVFNSALGDMMSEGFSEFLSYKVTKDLISDSVYTTTIRKKASMLTGFKVVPFARVNTRNDYHDRELYVYYYAPTIFLAIEKEIGEGNMWKWLQVLLNTPTQFTDYAFLRKTLYTTLNNSAQSEAIEKKYFTSDSSIDNALQTLKLSQ
ncbi:hypothetical protein [Flavihumibacter petaseus]|uniref:Peptidase M1 membrane alanine aminopeptidase domain-containing protein n=1 Tax=Flavihumibacter petaseus NBRC 106054 TaxID=1220578 RepID=A0A0E9N1X0_9BACT|nr:hypothetical protein [Flavihumibacter petaseus]GAO43335.1 hypothetical protein FPE01S_02_04400 [Flavihumibacter petaseus NBRC 106054]